MTERKTPSIRRMAAEQAAADARDRPVELPERGPATEDAPPPERERAEADTWIARPDLPAGSRTFVAAGDLIPYGLEQYPRESD